MIRVVGAWLCLGTVAVAILLPPHLPGGAASSAGVALLALAWIAFAVGAWLVRSIALRAAAALIIVGAVGLQLCAGFGPPRGSDDVYRYVWDGRVQAAGVNPYAHAPAAETLAGLRESSLWPSDSAWCVPPGATDPNTGETFVAGCTLINRPTVHTIYPPVAQALFAGIDLMPLAGPPYRRVQLTASVFAVATTVMLLVALPRRGLDPRTAVLWAWCPTVAIEAGSNAHVDVVATGAAAAGLLVLAAHATRRAAAVGGALLGLAIAAKVTPVLVLPAAIRRRPVTVLVAATAAVAATYLPHVLDVGDAVLGYLPGYLAEEGYDGRRFALLSWILPGRWAPVVAAVLLPVAAVHAARTADPDAPWQSAALTVGCALILTSPAYPWYALLLVVLVALGARPEWLTVAAAGYLAQYAGELGLAGTTAQRLGYGMAAVAVLAGWIGRQRASQVSFRST